MRATLGNDGTVTLTFRVQWSPEDGEYVGVCAEFPSLSWLAPGRTDAIRGIRTLVDAIVTDMRANAEQPPVEQGFSDRSASPRP